VREWDAEFQRRFERVRRLVRGAVVGVDMLGISGDVTKRVSAGATRDDRVSRTLAVIRGAVESEILVSPGYAGSWMNKYAVRAVSKGVRDAYARMKKAGMNVQLTLSLDAEVGRAAQRRADFIAQQNYQLLADVDDDMAARMQSIIQEGLLDGESPQAIARDLEEELDIGRARARTIARTETIGAHADATLDAFEEAGVEGVEAEVEFATAGDNRVCPQCEELEGQTFTIADARGVIPVHPNCRCAWLPVIPSATDSVVEDYDPSEPRVPAGSAEGGEWTAEGGAGSSPGTEGGGGGDVAKQRALDVAKKLKFSPSKMEFSDDDKKFSVAGKRMTKGGEYDPSTGKVTFFSHNVSPEDAELIAAHEVTHSMYHDYFGSEGYQQPLIHLFGSYDAFAREGGVDDYSNQWWRAVSEGKAKPEQAINETLASMAAIQYTTGRIVGGPEHRDLLRRIQRYRGVSGGR
jgi:SPP1 gp7 family putative phage head morphogenesis protein